VIDAVGFLYSCNGDSYLWLAPLGVELAMRSVSVSDLPPEILEHVLSSLPPADILKMKEISSI